MKARPDVRELGYADADGLETVAAWRCVEACPVRRLDTQAGPSSVTGKRSERSKAAPVEDTQWYVDNHQSQEYPNERGGPARFFHQSDWSAEVAEQLAAADPVRYQAKAARKERDAGLEELPVQAFGQSGGAQSKLAQGETEYMDAGIGLNVIKQRRNIHPTLKPIALTRWLATLLLPPAEYAPRRILVPFAGSAAR